MRVDRILVATALVIGAWVAAAPSAAAQPAGPVLAPPAVAADCAPPPTREVPADALRIIGSQDTVAREVYGDTDLLVIGGGTGKGVRLGQQYFVRRPMLASGGRGRPTALTTLGWLRVVAANETTAVARVDHLCAAMYPGDFLEPFVQPDVPAATATEEPIGDLDFGALNRVLGGDQGQSTVGVGSFVLVDRGADRETTAGMRFAVYRDVGVAGLPLAAVGEGVVVSVGPAMSVARITRSRDAIVAGDYVVPRK